MAPWPDDRVALLRRLVERGLSASAIGEAMDLTKNAVVGACRRRGFRLQGNNYGGGCRMGQVMKPKPVPVVRKRKPVVAPVVVVPSPVPPMPPTRRCQWLDGSGPPWAQCGAAVMGRGPYCAVHHARVFVRHREPAA